MGEEPDESSSSGIGMFRLTLARATVITAVGMYLASGNTSAPSQASRPPASTAPVSPTASAAPLPAVAPAGRAPSYPGLAFRGTYKISDNHKYQRGGATGVGVIVLAANTTMPTLWLDQPTLPGQRWDVYTNRQGNYLFVVPAAGGTGKPGALTENRGRLIIASLDLRNPREAWTMKPAAGGSGSFVQSASDGYCMSAAFGPQNHIVVGSCYESFVAWTLIQPSQP